MKFVVIIVMAVIAMIGIMIPSVFAETVSNNIGSVTIDGGSYQSNKWHSCEIIVYGFVEIVDGRGEIVVVRPDDSIYGPVFFLAGHDGSFTSKIYCGSQEGVHNVFVSYGGEDIGILQINPQQFLEDQKQLKIEHAKIAANLVEQQNQFFPKVTEEPIESKILGIAPFVDQSKDPQHYIDRYNNEYAYKEWFDENYPQYISIYEAVGVKDPFLDYLQKPIVEVLPTLNCEIGTIEKNGICVVETKVVEKELVKLETNSKFESKENLQGFCIILMLIIVPVIMIVLYVIILWRMNNDYISRMFAALILFGVFFVIWIALVFGVLSNCS